MGKRSLVCLLALTATAMLSTAAWAIPYASSVSVSGTNVTFYLNQDANNVTVNRDVGGSINLGALTKGSHTVDVGAATTWEIVVTHSAVRGWVQISVDNESFGGILTKKFWYPTGVAVNQNPSSPYFGCIYVANGGPGTTAGDARACTQGMYGMRPDTSDGLTNQGDNARDGGVTWNTATTTQSSPFRVIVAPDDKVFITDFTDSHSGLWIAAPDLSGTFDALYNHDTNAGYSDQGGGLWADPSLNFFHGNVVGMHIEGTGASRVLYTLDEDLSIAGNSYGTVWKNEIGTTSTMYSTQPTVQAKEATNVMLNTRGDLARDPSTGNWWQAQFRSVGNDVLGAPAISLWQDEATTGTLLWPTASTLGLSNGYGDIDVNGPTNKLCLGAIGSLGVYVIDISTPTAPFKEFTIPHAGSSRDVCFDIVGNIYVCNNSTETLRIFSRGGDTVAKTKSDGTFEYTPDNGSLIADPPRIVPALQPGATSIVISGVTGDATSVALYKNGSGSAMISEAPNSTPAAGQHTFTVPALALAEYYEATQTNVNGESARSKLRCVQPNPIGLPAPAPATTEDFEAASFDPCWYVQAPPLVLSTEQAHGGTQSAKDPAAGGGEIGTDLLPTTPDDSNPIIVDSWLYITANVPGAGGLGQSHFITLSNWTLDAYREDAVSDIYSIGMFDQFNTEELFPRIKFHARILDGANWIQLDQAGDRSTGWHHLQMRIGGTLCTFYVDGVRGADAQATAPGSMDSLYVSNRWSSDTGLDAYWDDVSISQSTNGAPSITVNNISATEGVAITPTDETGTDADSPDTVKLELLDVLPSGLSASAAVVSGNPAVITITGTPDAGTATGSPYVIPVQATDDFGLTTLDSFQIDIAAAPACNTPPQDTDGDGDVDVADFITFQACFNGPGNPWPGPPIDQAKCACLDLDDTGNKPGDGDVDVSDFIQFQACFNGPDQPPAC